MMCDGDVCKVLTAPGLHSTEDRLEAANSSARRVVSSPRSAWRGERVEKREV